MRINEIAQLNPFKGSVLQDVVYHATNETFDKFLRAAHGIYISQYSDYAELHYGKVIPLYVNVSNMFEPGSDALELDWVYDRDYDKVAMWLKKLNRQGYDAVRMYGDGDSIILIGSVDIVHADTRSEM